MAMASTSVERSPTWTCIMCTLLYTDASVEAIDEVARCLRRAHAAGGERALASLVKGWSNCIRSILSNSPYDTTAVGFCKLPRNCTFRLRRAGLTESEIAQIISKYGDRVGIPPFLLHPCYVRILLPNPGISLARRVNPFANIGRTAPLADQAKRDESLAAFFRTTSLQWEWGFDFTNITAMYSRMCGGKIPDRTWWTTSTNSSFDSTRDQGGKLGEIIDKVVNDFIYLTIEEIVPYRPSGPLYDVLGNVALQPEDWELGKPITDCLYTDIGQGFIDQRFGLFGMHWAIHDIESRFRDDFISDSPFISLGESIPKLWFSGSLPSRVEALSEEGFKARVITVTPLSVALLQIMLRHLLDPFVRRDPSVKIGLLSAVKLYDLMASISGSHAGLDNDGNPSFFHRSCESVDLTTATDSPYHKCVETVLRTFVSMTLRGHLSEFSSFVCDLALSPRDFCHPARPADYVHRCGIMMGEALSGVFLNVMSGIVRTYVDQLAVDFDWFVGETTDDADEFILLHQELIQDWLDSRRPSSFDPDSSQSGDDVIDFNDYPPGYLRRYFVLFYRILGLIPSESTFYSSESFGTFTEESCYRDTTTLGWVFLDCIKPRLFNPTSREKGLNAILSRIRQISSSLRFQSGNQDLVERLVRCANLMINHNLVIADRIDRYSLVPAFPEFMGGLDHPSSYLDDIQFDIPLVDRSTVVYLKTCDDDTLFDIKYHWISEEVDDNESSEELRRILRSILDIFRNLAPGDPSLPYEGLRSYPEDRILDRKDYIGWAEYYRDLRAEKQRLGLFNLDEIIEVVSNAFRLQLMLHDDVTQETNPMIRLRNRREFLISRARDQGADGHDFMWSDLKSLSWRLQKSFQGTVTLLVDVLEICGLDSLPLLSCPVRLSPVGVD